MFPEKNLLSTDLDWMMQSPQVGDAQLIQILIHEYYEKLYRLAVSVADNPERARNAVEKSLVETVSNRWRYWGNPSLKAWMADFVLRYSRDPSQKKRLLPGFPFFRSGRKFKFKVVPTISNESLSAESQTLWKGIVSLPSQDILLLVLRYVHGLQAPEIAYVLKMSESSILARLREIRQEIESRVYPQQRSQTSEETRHAGDIHPIYRQRLQATLDQHLKEEDQHELKQHLLVCAGCRGYSMDLAALDEQIGGCLQACWPSPKVTGGNPEAMLAGMGKHVGKTRQQRRISRLAKEVSLIAAAIFLVFAVSSIGKLTAAEPYPTPPAANPVSAADPGRRLNRPTGPTPTPVRRRRPVFPPTEPKQPEKKKDDQAVSQAASTQASQTLNFPPLKDHSSPGLAMVGVNLSGPVNLRLLLHYWGEPGNPDPYLQPNSQDKTVMFYEMVNYIEDHTRLKAVMRMGGDIQTLIHLVDAGIPVMVEKGFDSPWPDGWGGRYVIVDGYDQATGSLLLLGAFPEDGGDIHISYQDFEQNWRAFNYSYLIVYPSELSDQVQEILGSQADEIKNYQYAADKAGVDIQNLTSSRDLFFAWFNKGTSLTYLENYTGAKEAYDKAYSIYQSLPTEERPWRMLWYQTRPYWAYFYTASYRVVIDLATKTLDSGQKPVLEESFYWRALAKEALGDLSGAIQDLNEAIQINPNFIAGKYQLKRIQGE